MKLNLVIANTVCRACLKAKPRVKLGSAQCPELPETPTLFAMLTFCTAVQVRENDGFPNKICDDCVEQLTVAYAFKQLCLQSEQKLVSSSVIHSEPPPAADPSTPTQTSPGLAPLAPASSELQMKDEPLDPLHALPPPPPKKRRSENPDFKNDKQVIIQRVDYISPSNELVHTSNSTEFGSDGSKTPMSDTDPLEFDDAEDIPEAPHTTTNGTFPHAALFANAPPKLVTSRPTMTTITQPPPLTIITNRLPNNVTVIRAPVTGTSSGTSLLFHNNRISLPIRSPAPVTSTAISPPESSNPGNGDSTINVTTVVSFPCPLCGRRYASGHLLRSHICLHTHKLRKIGNASTMMVPITTMVSTMTMTAPVTTSATTTTSAPQSSDGACPIIIKRANLSPGEKLCCSLCDELFTTIHSMRRHYIASHKNPVCPVVWPKAQVQPLQHQRRVFLCSECGQVFAQKEKLRQHQPTCHVDTIVTDENSTGLLLTAPARAPDSTNPLKMPLSVNVEAPAELGSGSARAGSGMVIEVTKQQHIYPRIVKASSTKAALTTSASTSTISPQRAGQQQRDRCDSTEGDITVIKLEEEEESLYLNDVSFDEHDDDEDDNNDDGDEEDEEEDDEDDCSDDDNSDEDGDEDYNFDNDDDNDSGIPDSRLSGSTNNPKSSSASSNAAPPILRALSSMSARRSAAAAAAAASRSSTFCCDVCWECFFTRAQLRLHRMGRCATVVRKVSKVPLLSKTRR